MKKILEVIACASILLVIIASIYGGKKFIEYKYEQYKNIQTAKNILAQFTKDELSKDSIDEDDYDNFSKELNAVNVKEENIILKNGTETFKGKDIVNKTLQYNSKLTINMNLN
ncbi:hypothetical protein IAI10_16790 [Clostridium sp. 19966]|uniref:hypothetical protein n=1 Tax=Clostridium sp. 19966 TaxID=2768166 RepID=UPI0028DEA44E|nr:hypothetical protein [Clostridium sp. 19966]MDT8718325.1 hypothetical protein [Clostridium sp. 19966]